MLADIARDIPAADRYGRVVQALKRLFPCDAAALLRLSGGALQPLAVAGLSDDTLGRRFVVREHPRLARILASDRPVRFADSQLPDPYDGLIDASEEQLEVHDCLGATLRVDGEPWGVLTLDALSPHAFDAIEPAALETLVRLAEASVRAAEAVDRWSGQAQLARDEHRALEADDSGELVGKSAAMHDLDRLIRTVASSDLLVLVLGETGTGKELVAQRIHSLSPRSAHPLVHVNCAALPEALAESELFGHTRGAFTGAVAERRGKFELADGGTLLLDEIGELALPLQAKLLRVLQSGELQRVGSDRALRVDVRTIAATNRDLAREVAEGRFRADLYHRLSVFPLLVPPLRDRGRDVLEIAGRFLERNQRRLALRNLRLTKDARAALLAYPWPGNVRELEHVISRGALLAAAGVGRDRRVIEVDVPHLGLARSPQPTSAATRLPPLRIGQTLAKATEQFQSAWLRRLIDEHDGNFAAAARSAGMDRGNFHRLARRLGLR